MSGSVGRPVQGSVPVSSPRSQSSGRVSLSARGIQAVQRGAGGVSVESLLEGTLKRVQEVEKALGVKGAALSKSYGDLVTQGRALESALGGVKADNESAELVEALKQADKHLAALAQTLEEEGAEHLVDFLLGKEKQGAGGKLLPRSGGAFALEYQDLKALQNALKKDKDEEVQGELTRAKEVLEKEGVISNKSLNLGELQEVAKDRWQERVKEIKKGRQGAQPSPQRQQQQDQVGSSSGSGQQKRQVDGRRWNVGQSSEVSQDDLVEGVDLEQQHRLFQGSKLKQLSPRSGLGGQAETLIGVAADSSSEQPLKVLDISRATDQQKYEFYTKANEGLGRYNVSKKLVDDVRDLIFDKPQIVGNGREQQVLKQLTQDAVGEQTKVAALLVAAFQMSEEMGRRQLGQVSPSAQQVPLKLPTAPEIVAALQNPSKTAGISTALKEICAQEKEAHAVSTPQQDVALARQLLRSGQQPPQGGEDYDALVNKCRGTYGTQSKEGPCAILAIPQEIVSERVKSRVGQGSGSQEAFYDVTLPVQGQEQQDGQGEVVTVSASLATMVAQQFICGDGAHPTEADLQRAALLCVIADKGIGFGEQFRQPSINLSPDYEEIASSARKIAERLALHREVGEVAKALGCGLFGGYISLEGVGPQKARAERSVARLLREQYHVTLTLGAHVMPVVQMSGDGSVMFVYDPEDGGRIRGLKIADLKRRLEVRADATLGAFHQEGDE